MPELPKTLTVEKLKALIPLVRRDGDNSIINSAVFDIKTWIAELSPMEEPPNQSVVLVFSADLPHVPTSFQRRYCELDGVNSWYPSADIPKTKTWQEILAIDPRPQIIYKGGE
jgi:hypothetical protein